jgi:hypothetical protein
LISMRSELFIAEIRVRSQTSQCDIFDGKVEL